MRSILVALLVAACSSGASADCAASDLMHLFDRPALQEKTTESSADFFPEVSVPVTCGLSVPFHTPGRAADWPYNMSYGQSVACFGVRKVRGSQVRRSPEENWRTFRCFFLQCAEPVFTLRGVNRDVAFDVPVEYLPERYKSVACEIASTAQQPGVRLIPVTLLDMPEDEFADVPAILGYFDKYSRAVPSSVNQSARFDQFFKSSTTNDVLLSRAIWALLNFNQEMVLDGLRTTLVRREGSQQGVQMLEQTHYFPESYVQDTFFAKVREEMFVVPDGQRVVIPVIRNETQTGTHEGKLWYWLLDPHLSVFHWRWHINYPFGFDEVEYLDRDRRGEMFVFFHRQLISRYNAERLATGAAPVKALVLTVLEESWFPKLLFLKASRSYAGRQANTTLSVQTGVANIETWIGRYRDALQQGYMVTPDNEAVPLEGMEGLNTLANALEPSYLLSPNLDFYGSVHNNLHGVLGKAHDPFGNEHESTSVLTKLEVVIQDPAFFRIHQKLDDLYEEYKVTLPPYTKDELEWCGVTVQSVSLRSKVSLAVNELHTFWQETDLDVSLGLDYTPPGRVYGRFRHLQHEPFQYDIKVMNSNAQETRAYVRVFLLMLTDEKGQPLDAYTQQRYAIQMDLFDVTLKPGLNEVSRDSVSSAVSIDQDSVYTRQETYCQAQRVNQCRCGLPMNLLVPRGTAEGSNYKLFVMLTDYTADKAETSADEICHDGWVFCGVPGSQYYPDKRPMGFPFDRPYSPDVPSLAAFLGDNMAVQDIVVKFNDSRVEPPTALLPGEVSTSWMP